MPLCLNCHNFGQLIISKITRIVTTRRQIFGGKNVQNSISAGALPQSPSGELTAPLCWWSLQHSPWLHLRGLLIRGGEGGREGKRRRRGGSKKGVWPPIFTTDQRPWYNGTKLTECKQNSSSI